MLLMLSFPLTNQEFGRSCFLEQKVQYASSVWLAFYGLSVTFYFLSRVPKYWKWVSWGEMSPRLCVGAFGEERLIRRISDSAAQHNAGTQHPQDLEKRAEVGSN